MKRNSFLCAILCAALLFGLHGHAFAEMPLVEDADAYQRFAGMLAANGMAVKSDDEMSVSVNNYDGVDFITVSFAPVQGLTYNIEYEDDALYMAHLAIASDSELLENAQDLILLFFEAADPAGMDGIDGLSFVDHLTQTGEKTQQGDRSFQVMQPKADGDAFYQNLNAMVYFQ